jgi:hypothetical protein
VYDDIGYHQEDAEETTGPLIWRIDLEKTLPMFLIENK